jgi:hemophore-related protein
VGTGACGLPRRTRSPTGCAGALLGGLAAASIGAPTASAAPEQCGADSLADSVSTTTGSARTYLDAHPGANQAVTAAMGQPRDQAAVNLRGYFTAHPQEYYDLRGILAPIGDAQRQCNVSVLPPDLASAYRARTERGPDRYLLACCAAEGFANNQQRPFVAQNIERACD